MNFLVVYGSGAENLKLFSQLIANVLPDVYSLQILPAEDVSVREWRWADCLILGVSWNAALAIPEQDRLRATLPAALERPKMFGLIPKLSADD